MQELRDVRLGCRTRVVRHTGLLCSRCTRCSTRRSIAEWLRLHQRVSRHWPYGLRLRATMRDAGMPPSVFGEPLVKGDVEAWLMAHALRWLPVAGRRFGSGAWGRHRSMYTLLPSLEDACMHV